jgi:hypothetical protein
VLLAHFTHAAVFTLKVYLVAILCKGVYLNTQDLHVFISIVAEVKGRP